MNTTNLSLTPEQYAELENELHDRLTNSCAERITRRFFVADVSLIDPVLHNLQNIDCVYTFGEDIVVNKSAGWIEFTSQIPLLSFDCLFGLDAYDPIPKVHFMSMYLGLCSAIQTLHIYRVPHVTLSEENIFFDLASIAHLLPVSYSLFHKRCTYEQSCTLKDDLLSATSIFSRLSDQLFDTDNAPRGTTPSRLLDDFDHPDNWIDFEAYLRDIISGTIDPVLSPPETQPFFSNAFGGLARLSVASSFFKDILAKQIGNASPETEKIVSKIIGVAGKTWAGS
ncbi:hypothetical protein BLNAU_7853 [Blattamonas nauphoetae]|uniref:Uncharacterized protein n=1 Tax=Blattamonas nauphoetae TaxID=2049346 RepID=A0ABQ9Y0N0_9EUKA|nr:hypothetical protein BLNAU_7853 [Blattamonas nauphoetae]